MITFDHLLILLDYPVMGYDMPYRGTLSVEQWNHMKDYLVEKIAF